MPKNVHSSAARAVKTTLNLPADSSELLRSLAGQRGTTLAEVIRRALQLEEYLTKVRKEGGRILVEDEAKAITEVVIF
jgi:hypothetical protein